MVTYDKQLEKRILSYLDGWKVSSDDDFDDVSDLRLDDNKLITSDEVKLFWDKACLKISTYLYVENLPNDERIIEETCQYCAGLLYHKYTVNTSENYEDNNNGTGNSSYLINKALKNLEPFRNSTVSMWNLRSV